MSASPAGRSGRGSLKTSESVGELVGREGGGRAGVDPRKLGSFHTLLVRVASAILSEMQGVASSSSLAPSTYALVVCAQRSFPQFQHESVTDDASIKVVDGRAVGWPSAGAWSSAWPHESQQMAAASTRDRDLHMSAASMQHMTASYRT